MTDTEPPRLMIFLEEADGARERFAAILGAVPVACAVLVTRPGGTMLAGGVAADVIRLGQTAGTAMLVCDDDARARLLGADGVHLTAGPDLTGRLDAARKALGAKAIIGCDAGASRHDAMEAGEAGADYLAFADVVLPEDDPLEAGDVRSALVGWWSEVFEVPCVALDVEDAAAAADLARAGADFIGVSVHGGLSPVDCAARARTIGEAAATAGELAKRG